MKRKPKKCGRPAKRERDRVRKIAISITPERLAKVDKRGGMRSTVIGQMIDEAR